MFFGDVGGNFYALDAANGQKLWGQKIGGAIAGGVITYTANGLQTVAVATGFISRFGQLKSGPRGSRSLVSRALREPITNELSMTCYARKAKPAR